MILHLLRMLAETPSRRIRLLHKRERTEVAMHANQKGKAVNARRSSALASIVLWAAVNCLFNHATVAHAETQDQSAQHVVLRPKRRLSIEWGVTDVQYRQEVLALTPLGTSYDDVRAFILKEWSAEKISLKSDPKAPSWMTILGGSDIVLQPSLNLCGENLFLRDEPPHIKIIDVGKPFPACEGRQYIQPFFKYKPVWWKRSLYVTVLYVFDAHSRLIDLFAHGGIVMPSP